MRDFRILLFIFASSKLKTLMHSLFKVILAFCLTFFAGNRMIGARRIIMTDLSSLDRRIKVKPGIDARYEAHLSAMKNKLRFAGVTSKQAVASVGRFGESILVLPVRLCFYLHETLSLRSITITRSTCSHSCQSCHGPFAVLCGLLQ